MAKSRPLTHTAEGRGVRDQQPKVNRVDRKAEAAHAHEPAQADFSVVLCTGRLPVPLSASVKQTLLAQPAFAGFHRQLGVHCQDLGLIMTKSVPAMTKGDHL